MEPKRPGNNFSDFEPRGVGDGGGGDGGDGGRILQAQPSPIPLRPGIKYPVRVITLTPIYIYIYIYNRAP